MLSEKEKAEKLANIREALQIIEQAIVSDQLEDMSLIVIASIPEEDNPISKHLLNLILGSQENIQECLTQLFMRDNSLYHYANIANSEVEIIQKRMDKLSGGFEDLLRQMRGLAGDA